MKNTASFFTIALASLHTFFFILGNNPRVKSDAYLPIRVLSQYN